MRLRLVSWNVHGCVGVDHRFDPARTAAALGALEPDVALLQEVGDNRGVHPPIDQAATLANQLGLTCALGITMPMEPYGYGNVTLSRFPVLDVETFDLSVRGREPRACLRVTVGRDELQLTTLNVHLGLGPGERRRQLRILLDGALDGVTGPIAIGGDFNDFPPGPVSRTLGRDLVDAGAAIGRTFPSWRPLLRLDRIYLNAQVRSARVDRSARSVAASDHLPLVVEVEVSPSQLEPLVPASARSSVSGSLGGRIP
jgi:endonuclease/exonuclease/phosphatase family metal-dependent hydrolase